MLPVKVELVSVHAVGGSAVRAMADVGEHAALLVHAGGALARQRTRRERRRGESLLHRKNQRLVQQILVWDLMNIVERVSALLSMHRFLGGQNEAI